MNSQEKIYFPIEINIKDYQKSNNLNELIQNKLQQNHDKYEKKLRNFLRKEYHILIPKKETNLLFSSISPASYAMDYIGEQTLAGFSKNLIIPCEIDYQKLQQNVFVFGKSNKNVDFDNTNEELQEFIEQTNDIEK